MKQLSVRIGDGLETALDDFRDGLPYEVSESEIVRTALREHIERESEIEVPEDDL